MIPMTEANGQTATLLRAAVVLIFTVLPQSGCGDSDSLSLPADPRVILQAHLSHGIGDSPLDSPLIQDPVAAAMIVGARQCAAPDKLREAHPDGAAADRLLEQLESDGLIVIHEAQACTTFPILLNDARARYARLVDGVAEDAWNLLSPELEKLIGQVRERGWEDWQYHFVWSQLFDSQFAWTEMMQRELAPSLGHLIAWVVYPDHEYRSGTNYYPDTELPDYWLMVTWRPDAANTLGLVGSSWKLIHRVALEGGSMSAEERASLTELGLLDDSGKLQAPILRNGDPLLDLLESAALRYIAFLQQRMPLESLTDLSGADPQAAFAMAYHDVSWELVGRLVRSGQINVPPALQRGGSGGQPSMRGVAALAPVHPPFAELIRAAIAGR